MIDVYPVESDVISDYKLVIGTGMDKRHNHTARNGLAGAVLVQ